MTRFLRIAFQALGFGGLLSLAITGAAHGMDYIILEIIPASSLGALFVAAGMIAGSQMPKHFPEALNRGSCFYLLAIYGVFYILGTAVLFYAPNNFFQTLGAIVAAFCSAGIAFFVFRIIGKLDYHDQSLYVVLAFAECGLLMFLFAQAPQACILPILSLLCVFVILHSIGQYKCLNINPRREAEKENDFTKEEAFVFSPIALFTTGVTGFLWTGMVSSLFICNTNEIHRFELFGICLLATTAIMLFDRMTGKHLGEDFLLKIFSLFVFFFLIVLPQTTGQARVIVACLSVVLFTCDVIVNLLAIAEVARFNQISPALSFGKSLFYFFVGAALGVFVFLGVFPSLNQSTIIAVSDSIFFFILIVNIFVFKNNFPGDAEDATVIVTTLPSPSREDAESDSPITSQKSDWKQRVSFIADKYHLTSRQTEVFNMLLKGRNAQFIADDFVISYSTAKAHIHNIYTKLGVHSQQELISMVENVTLPSDS